MKLNLTLFRLSWSLKIYFQQNFMQSLLKTSLKNSGGTQLDLIRAKEEKDLLATLDLSIIAHHHKIEVGICYYLY